MLLFALAVLVHTAFLTTQCPAYQGKLTLPADVEYQFTLNPSSALIETEDMAVDQEGNIYIVLMSGANSYQIAKFLVDSTVVWSVTSSTLWVQHNTLRISSDSSFLIFADGTNGIVKLDASTGAYLGYKYVGDFNIRSLYAATISPDSS